MVGSGVDVKWRVVGFAVWPKLSGVEVKGCIQKICYMWMLYVALYVDRHLPSVAIMIKMISCHLECTHFNSNYR